MALEWNPNTMQYEQVAGTDPTNMQSALAGSILPQLSPGEQYQAAARGVYGSRFEDNPFLARAVGAQASPLYGRYLSTYNPFGGDYAAQAPSPQGFGQWLRGTPTDGTYSGMGKFGTTVPGGAPVTDNWANIINTARSMSPTYTGAAPNVDANTYAAYADMVGNESMANALASAMTYRPGMGRTFSGLRQQGLGRLRRDFEAESPGATAADWLGYLAGQQDVIGTGSPYFVPA